MVSEITGRKTAAYSVQPADDFDLPTPAEAAKMLGFWRTIAPPGQHVALLIRDLQRVRAIGAGGQPLPAILGSGAWFAAMLPTVSDDPLPFPGDPRFLACFAYRSARGALDSMVVWVVRDPDEFRPENAPPLVWQRLAWPDRMRSMLLLHRLAAEQHEGFIAPLERV